MADSCLTGGIGKLMTVLPRLTFSQKWYLAERDSGRYRHDRDVALAIGIHPGTVYNWRHKHPAFRQAEEALGAIWVETANLVTLARLTVPSLGKGSQTIPKASKPNRS